MRKATKIKNIMDATTLLDCYKNFYEDRGYLVMTIGFKNLERLEKVIKKFELPKPNNRYGVKNSYHMATWIFKI